MGARAWVPILEGEAALRAAAVLEAIARDVGTRSLVARDELVPSSASRAAEATLGRGLAGRALLYAYMARWREGNDRRTAYDLLDAASIALAEVPMSSSLYEGFAGIAWAHTHLSRVFTDGGGNATEDVDKALSSYLATSPWSDEYDLVGGLVGLGVYALEQPMHPRACRLLDQVLDRLAELAESRGRGVAWQTPLGALVDRARRRGSVGRYNLGVAHGIPGVVALLGMVAASGASPAATPLLQRAMTWLLDQRLGSDRDSGFAYWTDHDSAGPPARLAWCYGDAGVAAALLIAARGLGSADWEREALAVARRAADRPVATSGVRDAGLCHGAAGVAHVFNRLYQATGEPWLRDAARLWFTRTLDLRRPGEGSAGFLCLDPSDGEHRWLTDRGLLTGTAGIGLALLAACTDIEPAWDRVMLLSIPDRRA